MDILFPLLLLGLAFVVLFVLPSRARQRMALQNQQLQESLAIGTEIMTTSGLYGRIATLDEQSMELEIAPGVLTRWDRQAVRQVRQPEPATEPDESGESTEG